MAKISKRKILHNTAWLTVFKTVSTIIGFFLSIIVVRLLTNEQYGILSFVDYLTSVFFAFISLGIPATILRFVAGFDAKEQASYIKSLFRSSVFIILVTFLIGIGFLWIILNLFPQIQTYLSGSFYYLFLFILAGFPGILYTIFSSLFEGLNRFDLTSKISIIATFTNFFLVTFLLLSGFGLYAIITATIVSGSFSLILISLWFRRLGFAKKTERPKFPFRRVRNYAFLVFVMTVLDLLVWNRIGNFFLGAYGSIEDVGYFNLAYSFSFIITSFIASSMLGSLKPVFTNLYESGKKSQLSKLFRKSMVYTLVLVLPLILSMFFFSDDVITLVYTNRYLAASVPMKILFLALSLSVVASPAGMIIYSLERLDFPIKVHSILFVFEILLITNFVPIYGVVGMAMIALFIRVLSITLGTNFALRITKTKFPFKTVTKVSLCSGIMFLVLFLTRTILPISIFSATVQFIFASLIYLIALIYLRALDKEDVLFFTGIIKEKVGTMVSTIETLFGGR